MPEVKVITQKEVTINITGKLEPKKINGIKFYDNFKIIMNVGDKTVEFIVPVWATNFRLVDDNKAYKSLVLVYRVTNTDIQSANDPEDGGTYAWLPRSGNEIAINQISVGNAYLSM